MPHSELPNTRRLRRMQGECERAFARLLALFKNVEPEGREILSEALYAFARAMQEYQRAAWEFWEERQGRLIRPESEDESERHKDGNDASAGAGDPRGDGGGDA